MISLQQIRYVLSVCDLNSFGKAAKKLNISQPSLSIQIQKAEDLLGVVLFDRSKKPVIATEKGLDFIKQARSVLESYNQLISDTTQSSKIVKGNISIGVIPTVSTYLLPLFIDKFLEQYPDVHLHIQEMTTKQIIGALNNDQLDVGIAATPLNQNGIKESVLYTEDFMVFMHADHKLAKKSSVSIKNLGKHHMWLLQDGHCFKGQMQQICNSPNSRIYKNLSLEGGSLDMLKNLIIKTKGLTLIPKLMADNLSKTEKIKHLRTIKPSTYSREISLIYSRSNWKRSIIDVLSKCIIDNMPKNTCTNENVVEVKSF